MYILLFIPQHLLSGWPVVAGCGYMRLLVTFYLLDAEQIWQALSFMQVKSTNDSDTLQRCISLLASRMHFYTVTERFNFKYPEGEISQQITSGCIILFFFSLWASFLNFWKPLSLRLLNWISRMLKTLFLTALFFPRLSPGAQHCLSAMLASL